MWQALVQAHIHLILARSPQNRYHYFYSLLQQRKGFQRSGHLETYSLYHPCCYHSTTLSPYGIFQLKIKKENCLRLPQVSSAPLCPLERFDIMDMVGPWAFLPASTPPSLSVIFLSLAWSLVQFLVRGAESTFSYLLGPAYLIKQQFWRRLEVIFLSLLSVAQSTILDSEPSSGPQRVIF